MLKAIMIIASAKEKVKNYETDKEEKYEHCGCDLRSFHRFVRIEYSGRLAVQSLNPWRLFCPKQ